MAKPILVIRVLNDGSGINVDELKKGVSRSIKKDYHVIFFLSEREDQFSVEIVDNIHSNP